MEIELVEFNIKIIVITPAKYFNGSKTLIKSSISIINHNLAALPLTHIHETRRAEWITRQNKQLALAQIDEIREYSADEGTQRHEHTCPSNHVGPPQPCLNLVLTSLHDRSLLNYLPELGVELGT